MHAQRVFENARIQKVEKVGKKEGLTGNVSRKFAEAAN